MCGIFAVIQNKEIWPPGVLQAATDTMEHRGPDASGYWQEEGIFLGHRRLAIIDLKTGAQPMLSHDKCYVITFNGEIYNFREIRFKLEKAGHQFITNSDTEVILEAYRCWGEECVRYLEGMFAFVLWDRKKKRLLAARDRLGIKPLCWAIHQGNFLFSSTLEPLFQLPDFPRMIDYEAFRDLLVFDYIAAPRTILQNIRKLKPGHILIWEPTMSLPVSKEYWGIPPPIGEGLPLNTEDIYAQVEATLDKAIFRQMVSDVPLGAFLSGGIDSSLLVAFMARHSVKPIKTFSISFQGKQYDESIIAQEVAKVFGTEHTVLPGEEISSEKLFKIITGLDEPFADPAVVPTFILSALTKQYVTVALAGDGGDEVFGGYSKYLMGEDHLRNPWYPWIRPLKWLLDNISARPSGIDCIYWRTLNPHERIPFAFTHYGCFPVCCKDLKQVLSEQAYNFINAKDFFNPWLEHMHQWGNKYTTDTLMRTDLRTYLSENCLVKTDRASMMSSLEVRVPYLDEMLVEKIVPLSAEIKIQKGQLKSLLLPLAKKLLPRSVWDRPKHGFTVPLGRNLAKQWFTLAEQLLAWGKVNLPIFNYDYLHKLMLINYQTHKIGRELWTPLVILMWCYNNANKVTL